MTSIRAARPDELAAVAGILDAAALALDHDSLPARLADGSGIVAADGDRLLGALVLARRPGEEGENEASCHIEAVAVRPGRRGQGIGTALVREASRRCDRLVADCDEVRRPFYDELGFTLEPIGSDRYRAVLDTDEAN